MAEARLNIRVDSDIKAQAEYIFQKLGMTMSGGVNIFLSKVVAEQGIPFPVTLKNSGSQGQYTHSENTAIKLIDEDVIRIKREAEPITDYIDADERPRLAYPEGLDEFIIEEK